MNQSSNKSKKFCINRDIAARQKLCEAAKKRMRGISENVNDKAKEKMCKSDQKRKQTL